MVQDLAAVVLLLHVLADDEFYGVEGAGGVRVTRGAVVGGEGVGGVGLAAEDDLQGVIGGEGGGVRGGEGGGCGEAGEDEG